jgi:hypothetical protein
MRMQRLIAIVLAASFLMTGLSLVASDSEATYVGHDEHEGALRVFNIYYAELEVEQQFDVSGYRVFIKDSDNEKQFVDYVVNMKGTMPSGDDSSSDLIGKTVHIYTGRSSGNNDNELDIFFQNGNRIVVEGKLLCSSQLPVYVCNNHHISVRAVYDEEKYRATFNWDTLESGKQYDIQAYDKQSFVMNMKSGYWYDGVYADVDYEISGFWTPSGHGEGGMVVSALLIGVSVLILVGVMVLSRGPKWAR